MFRRNQNQWVGVVGVLYLYIPLTLWLDVTFHRSNGTIIEKLILLGTENLSLTLLY